MGFHTSLDQRHRDTDPLLRRQDTLWRHDVEKPFVLLWVLFVLAD